MRLALATLALGACVEHVQLAPAPVGAPAAARLAAYQQLAPKGFGSYQNRHGNDLGFLVLGDGSRVYYPEDLAPVVPADSPAARAGAHHRGAWGRMIHWLKIAGVGYGAAIVVPAVALATMRNDDARTEVMIGGAVGGMALGTVGFVGAALDAFEANGDRATAFLTYDDALRAEFHLCVAGLEVYDCAAGAAAASAPSVRSPGVP